MDNLFVKLSAQKPEEGLWQFHGAFYECLMSRNGHAFSPVGEVEGDIDDAFDIAHENTIRSAHVCEGYVSKSQIINDLLRDANTPLCVISNTEGVCGAGAFLNTGLLKVLGERWNATSICVIPFSEDAVIAASYRESDSFIEWATDLLRDVIREGIETPLLKDEVLVYDIAA